MFTGANAHGTPVQDESTVVYFPYQFCFHKKYLNQSKEFYQQHLEHSVKRLDTRIYQKYVMYELELAK